MTQKELNRLGKFLDYILGRHPDEFGLVPNSQGFVKVKELLKAVNEESDWRHLRKHHLSELCFSHPTPPIEIADVYIRAINRNQLPLIEDNKGLPKLLYTCIRTKAHRVVFEKGVFPRDGDWVILASTPSMALRIGKRIDPTPVLLTINTQQVLEKHIKVMSFGESLFLTEHIPSNCLTGPPLPKDKHEKKEKLLQQPSASLPTPGSFYLDFIREENGYASKISGKGKKEKGWKEARRRENRRRKNDW